MQTVTSSKARAARANEVAQPVGKGSGIAQVQPAVSVGRTPNSSAEIGFGKRAELIGSAIRAIFVEDDDFYRQAVEAELVAEGFAVHAFADGESMLTAVASGLKADVVVLDWGLKSESGIDLLSHLRERGLDWPVVFLTGRNSSVHESLALQRGAADFVDKSRDVAILTVRLRLAASRRRDVSTGSQDQEETFQCGRLALRPRASRAHWDRVDVGLTVNEFKITHLLASNVGSFISYRKIYDCVHHVGFRAGSGDNGYRTNVRSAIRRIREKFKALDPEFDEIQTFSSFGYCWRQPTSA
jgi:two-component system response regulator ChvI